MASLQPTTFVLIALNVLVYVLNWFQKLNINNRLALNTNLVLHYHQWYRVFTSMFVHFGFAHILMNMIALYYFSRQVDGYIEPWKFLIIYLGSGICGSLLAMLSDKIHHFNGISGGASGAIFGILGGILAMMIKENGGAAGDNLPMIIGLIVYIVIMLIPGFKSKKISNAGHLGGLIGGFGLGFLLFVR